MRKKKTRRAVEAAPAPDSDYQHCLQQAEICCEQARDAARLKRIEAACGLFSTAQSLLRRAIGIGGDACSEARERLASITTEMAAYCELSRSQSRAHTSHHISHGSMKTAQQPAPVRVTTYTPPTNYRR